MKIPLTVMKQIQCNRQSSIQACSHLSAVELFREQAQSVKSSDRVRCKSSIEAGSHQQGLSGTEDDIAHNLKQKSMGSDCANTNCIGNTVFKTPWRTILFSKRNLTEKLW